MGFQNVLQNWIIPLYALTELIYSQLAIWLTFDFIDFELGVYIYNGTTYSTNDFFLFSDFNGEWTIEKDGTVVAQGFNVTEEVEEINTFASFILSIIVNLSGLTLLLTLLFLSFNRKSKDDGKKFGIPSTVLLAKGAGTTADLGVLLSFAVPVCDSNVEGGSVLALCLILIPLIFLAFNVTVRKRTSETLSGMFQTFWGPLATINMLYVIGQYTSTLGSDDSPDILFAAMSISWLIILPMLASILLCSDVRYFRSQTAYQLCLIPVGLLLGIFLTVYSLQNENPRGTCDQYLLVEIATISGLLFIPLTILIAASVRNFRSGRGFIVEMKLMLVDGGSLLHWSIMFGNLETCKQVVERNKNLVNFSDLHGFSPLHIACVDGREDIAEFLIDQGADVNIRNEEGFTAIHMLCYPIPAAAASHVRPAELISLLHEKGADLNIANKHKRTPLDIATKHSSPEIVSLLKRLGAFSFKDVLVSQKT